MTALFPVRCCSSYPLVPAGPDYERVWCDLPVGHEAERWHEGVARDGTRYAWDGVGCPLARPLGYRERPARAAA